jgi:hypothetical protein
MKPKYLYRGSVREIKGNKLLPKQASDLGERPENLRCAVYATNIKDIAIAMALISCKGVNCSSLYFKRRPFGVIYEGWPKQKYIYLYMLPSKTFKQEGGSGNQWYSIEPVKPSKVEKLKVSDYISLVRKSTDKEREKFFGKYKHKFN